MHAGEPLPKSQDLAGQGELADLAQELASHLDHHLAPGAELVAELRALGERWAPLHHLAVRDAAESAARRQVPFLLHPGDREDGNELAALVVRRLLKVDDRLEPLEAGAPPDYPRFLPPIAGVGERVLLVVGLRDRVEVVVEDPNGSGALRIVPRGEFAVPSDGERIPLPHPHEHVARELDEARRAGAQVL